MENKELINIGNKVLNEINISMYNAEPTIQKCIQIHNELVMYDYKITDKEITIKKAREFFKHRTPTNMVKLFKTQFGIPFNSMFSHFLALNFHNATVSEKVIEEVAEKTFKHLMNIKILFKYGVDESVLFYALVELYSPRYYESVWKFSVMELFYKIKTVLQKNNKTDFLNQIEDIFYQIDPRPNKPVKKQGLINEDVSHDGHETGVDDIGSVESNTKQEGTHSEKGKKGDAEITSLTRDEKILGGEVEYIKGILGRFKKEAVPQNLDEKLFPRADDQRPPIVRNFYVNVKTYNLLFKQPNIDPFELFERINFHSGAIKDLGEKAIQQYEAMTNTKISVLEEQLGIKVNSDEI